MRNHAMSESLRICTKLIRLTERDSYIPSSSFSGETADVLRKQRKRQLARLETVCRRLKALK